MSDRYAYLNADGIVVQAIAGALDAPAHDALLRDYGILYGAVSCVRVEDDRAIWIGGSYTDGEFTPQPEPEPLTEVITETII
jgi:hypothetical protein